MPVFSCRFPLPSSTEFAKNSALFPRLRIQLAGNALAFDKPAAFDLTAALHLLGSDGLVELGIGFYGVAEFLTQKADVIIDLDDAALRRQVLHHLIGHIARRIANRAAGGVRSDQRGFARFERVVKSLVADV